MVTPAVGAPLAVIGGLSLAVMFAVESSTWFFRAQGDRTDLGGTLARANQLLYSSRLFAFGFQLVISLMVDTRAGWWPIWLTFAAGFGATIAVHLVAFHVPGGAVRLWQLFAVVGAPDRRATRPGLRAPVRGHVVDRALFTRTLLATMLLAAAATLPFVLASLFAQLRMTMGSVAQVMNFFGSITMISLVEPVLYRSIDREALGHVVFDYLLGRLWGLGVCFGVILLTGVLAWRR